MSTDDVEPQGIRFSLRTKALMGALALSKIWLARAVPLRVMADSDEKTFLLQTQGLLSGHWLGNYTIVTLVKAPFYSLFLAATFLLGVPALMAQQALYVVACAVFLLAIRRALASWSQAQFVLLYAFLVFNPMTNLANERLLRNHLYASLGVLLVAGVAGVLVQTDRSWTAALKWQVVFLLALTAQWLSREESFWILPFLVIYTLLVVWRMRRTGSFNWPRITAFIVPPYLAVALSVFSIAAMNQRTYGVFVTNEQQSSEMNDAVGAIHRVTPAVERNHYDVVTKETRERIYAVSPAFAELRDSLEGAVGRKWADPTCEHDLICADNDVGWGWFTWELRHAAMVTGHQGNAAEAARFYERIAEEINAACADRRLSCQPGRSSTMPAWENKYLGDTLARFWSTLKFVTSFRGFTLDQIPNEGSPELLAQYSELTLEPVKPSLSELQVSGWALSTKSPVEFSVRDANGGLLEFAEQRTPRADVAEFAKKIGYEQPVMVDSGFRLRAWCPSECHLYVKGGNHPDAWQKAVPLRVGSTGSNPLPVATAAEQNRDPYLVAMLNGDVIVYVDSVSPAGVSGIQLQSRLNRFKLSVLAGIALLYQRLAHLVIVISVILFLLVWLQALRRRAVPVWVVVVTLITLLFFNRLTVMVLVDVLAIRGISQFAEYEQYLYALLLMSSGLLIFSMPRTLRQEGGGVWTIGKRGGPRERR